MMTHRRSSLLALGLCAALGGSVASAQRVGQSTLVQFGRVQNAETVRLDSDATKGALIGGTIGLISGSGRRGAPVRNGILGAAIGGIGTAAVQGNRTAIAYTVAMTDGTVTRVVTDQREIRPGDCVAVERSGQTANIRREPAAFCDRANEAAIRSVRPSVQREAVQCQQAKQELADATTKEAVDLASRKIELLCGG
jgi:hypothetical protein